VEPAIARDPAGFRYQFERSGYFCSDAVDSAPDKLVFNRTVSLRDTWAKLTKKAEDVAKPDGRTRSDRESRRVKSGSGPAAQKQHVERTPDFAAKVDRYTSEHGLSKEDAEIIAANRILARVFEDACAAIDKPKTIANWVVNDLRREAKGFQLGDCGLTGATLASLVQLVEDETINRAAAREVFADMVKLGGDPMEIVRNKGLEQVSDATSLGPLVEQVMAENAAKVEEYRNGKVGLLGFFIGQVMGASQGKANPSLVKKLVLEKLG
jgi:glutaminyl-tRNA synthetase